MHYKSEAGEVFVELDDGFSEFLLALAWEETVVDIKRRVEEERRSFGIGVLAKKPTFDGFSVAVFIFGKMAELDWRFL